MSFSDSFEEWSCDRCTYIQPKKNDECVLCGNPNPTQLNLFSMLKAIEDEEKISPDTNKPTKFKISQKTAYKNLGKNSSEPRGFHDWCKVDNEKKNIYMSKFNRYNKPTCILLIGVTGSGKSSICNIMGCNDARVGHGANSQTQTNQILKNHKYTFIDTMGTEDSNHLKFNSEMIMKDILKQCFKDQVSKVKIIWTIACDTTRCRKSFQVAAKFINSLGNNAWKSLLIIRKGGEKCDNIDGLIKAINKHKKVDKDYIRSKYFGVTCIDPSFNPQPNKLKLYDMCLRTSINPMTEYGLYKKKDYIQLIDIEIHKLESIDLNWDIKACKHCIEIGDPRFVSSECHYKKIKYHVNPQRFHSGNSEWYHLGSWKRYTRAVTIEKDTIYDELNKAAKQTAGLSLTMYANPFTHGIRLFQSKEETITEEYWQWSCCNNTGENSSGCKTRCSNCKNDWGSYGCAYRCGNCKQQYDPANSNGGGCKSKCSKCEGEWGKSKCW